MGHCDGTVMSLNSHLSERMVTFNIIGEHQSNSKTFILRHLIGKKFYSHNAWKILKINPPF